MKQSAKTQSLHALIAPAVAACDVELWGIEFLQQGRRSLLRIYIDKPAITDDVVQQVDLSSTEDVNAEVDELIGQGVGVQDCVRVTHQVSGVLDLHDPIADEYALEVSSPGWDRQFFQLAQMSAYVGQTVALRLISPVANRRKMNGILEDVREDGLTLSFEGQVLQIDADNIDKANLVYQD
ncbi:MAG: ribosome maturation factor RimP [Pseudomonadota bacterium]|nr:ribosome maturation factor RimP [Pseudomonadota bacterium]